MKTLALGRPDELGFLALVLTSEICAHLPGAGVAWIFPLPPRPDDFYRARREGQSTAGKARQLRIDNPKVKKG